MTTKPRRMISEAFDIKLLRSKDLPVALNMFRTTIKTINARDYSDAELELWLSRVDLEKWEDRIRNDFFIKAENGKELVGFASLKNGRYIDLLYVHKDHQGRGIATLMLHTLIKKGVSEGHRSFDTHASKTAMPFFEKKGFRMIKSNTVGYGVMTLTNYLMNLELA